MEQMFLANGALMIVVFLSGHATVLFSLETLDHLWFRSSKWITLGNERLQKNILGNVLHLKSKFNHQFSNFAKHPPFASFCYF
jgi:hypothetical protein